MYDVIKMYDWQLLVAIAVGVTFLVEVFNRVTPKWLSARMLLFLISLMFAVLRLPFDFSSWLGARDFAFNLLVSMGFSILFYEYLGHWLVEKMFGTLFKEKISGQIDGNDKTK